MTIRTLFLSAASLTLMAGCTPTQPKAADSMMDDDSNAMMQDDTWDETGSNTMMADDMKKEDKMMKDEKMEDDTSAMQKAIYAAFTPAVLTNGETKVLFFHAAWCPVCRTADATLTSWYNAGEPTINTYQLDYDTETVLRAKYGVTNQHTFVLVDGQGNAIQTVQGPSDALLMKMVGA